MADEFQERNRRDSESVGASQLSDRDIRRAEESKRRKRYLKWAGMGLLVVAAALTAPFWAPAALALAGITVGVGVLVGAVTLGVGALYYAFRTSTLWKRALALTVALPCIAIAASVLLPAATVIAIGKGIAVGASYIGAGIAKAIPIVGAFITKSLYTIAAATAVGAAIAVTIFTKIKNKIKGYVAFRRRAQRTDANGTLELMESARRDMGDVSVSDNSPSVSRTDSPVMMGDRGSFTGIARSLEPRSMNSVVYDASAGARDTHQGGNTAGGGQVIPQIPPPPPPPTLTPVDNTRSDTGNAADPLRHGSPVLSTSVGGDASGNAANEPEQARSLDSAMTAAVSQ